MSAEATLSTTFGLLRGPGQIIFGSGAIEHLATATVQLGKRVLVCCDPRLVTSPAWVRAHAALVSAGAEVEVLADIVAELPLASVEEAGRLAARHRPDVVLGFGGGSALDLAKLVALLLTHPGGLREYYGENTVPWPVLPIVAVPTTAGTGSEVTPVAVVTDPDRELKVGISSPHLIPAVALVDPDLTHSTPATVTAHAGIDAFVHAVEAFTAVCHEPQWNSTLPVFVGRNSLSNPLAKEAIALIGGGLHQAVHHPGDTDARAAVARGSLLAGMAFGTGGTHLSHAIQYPVGTLTGTPHGLGTGLLLPYVLQAFLPVIELQLEQIGRQLGVTTPSEVSAPHANTAQLTVDRIAELVTGIGIPATLAEIGITREQLPRIAELAHGVTRLAQNSPHPPTREFIEAIATAAWSGDRASLHFMARSRS